MLGRLFRFLLIVLTGVAMLVIGAGVYARYQLRASLPLTEGSLAVTGLTAPVTIGRDRLGVPTVTGASREDVSRALGFLHAQDRFFQMDLQRRQPAGELSALVGPPALEADRQSRLHRSRDVARRAVELADPSYRKILTAYAEGVNAGLAALEAPPFEYLLLRATPEPWRPEDSMLTILAMFGTLQGRQAGFEQTIGTMRDALPEPFFRFVAAPGSEWETPDEGQPLVRPAIPGPDVFDLRKQDVRATCFLCVSVSPWPVRDPDEAAIIGSNNWAVDGAHTSSGAALVANDMHLAIGVPIIWYRASLAFPDAAHAGSVLHVTGVTLPGLPSVVVGSNGQVAWGFTNSGGDWSDLVRIEPDARDETMYLTPEGPKAFDVSTESIAVKGAEAASVSIRSTIWGPIVWKDAKGVEYAQRWLAHDPKVVSSDITLLERATSVEEVLAGAMGLGIPNQNITIGDRSGHIGWTIAGTIPRRVGFDGFTPESWADGTRRWDGYLAREDFPRIVDPGIGRIWTANAPVVEGAMLATIGEGGYADGIRARLIRDRLMKIEKATPADLLGVQMEDRALFLERWRKLVLGALAPEAVQADPKRAQFRSLIESTWTGRASPDSVAYRLVRTFRASLVRQVMLSLTAPARDLDPSFDYTRSLRGEGPVWQLLTERPLHLLDPKFASWDEALLAAVDAAIAELTRDGAILADRTWGEANRAQIVHPLAAGVPFFGRWLNMPDDALPGDVFTPRASTPRTGPSERMVVSPGREEEGILHMPTGQSGHPLSPNYGDQYRAWLNGEPLPFLPGPTVSTLTLTPR